MTSQNMLVAALAGAMTWSGLALAGDAQSSQEAVATAPAGERLSASDIAKIRGAATNLPPYCEAFYIQDPETGELVCNAVVCRPPGGFPEIFECSEFGL